MSNANNTIIQVRSRLKQLDIKLWELPYYFEGVGVVESEIDRLANEFHIVLNISLKDCKCALSELQDGALSKLARRKEFLETGRATLTVRCIGSSADNMKTIEIKSCLSDTGKDLQSQIAAKLLLDNPDQVKCIAAGKIIASNCTLNEQGIRNNQQLLALVGCGSSGDSNGQEAMYARIRRIKNEVKAIVDSDRRLIEMEDQDGNPVVLPPEESRAILMGMGFSEKARAAMKHKHYDEALLLLLEAEEKFNKCDSKFLDSVDNYALLNLDIIWCYMLLKNVSQLPDAQRRLTTCERSFHRSYGKDFERLIALKGRSCPERALIMRLHLLQAVVLFHQNQRDEAYMRLITAATELREVKVNDEEVQTLVEMGFEEADARLAMRSCAGNIAEAVQFITEKKGRLAVTCNSTENERMEQQRRREENDNGKDYVNPRNVRSLIDMGFEHELVVEALKRTKNDVSAALDLIQNQSDVLRASLSPAENVDDNLVAQFQQLGFDTQLVRLALKTTKNNMERAVEFLIKLFDNEDEVLAAIERITAANEESTTSNNDSLGANSSLATLVLNKAKEEIDAYKAYKRFNSDLQKTEQDYLDLPLVEEEQILIEYRRLLEKTMKRINDNYFTGN